MNQYNNNFTDLMLKELLKHGYSGEELLNEYKKAQSAIKPAINALLEEAHNAAIGKTKSYTSDDVFS